jgi:biotin-dependent carboxylase-like uncharacterized protein
MAGILIESPGLFTTVQDTGRYGYQRFGMPVSGAMDVFSLRLAYILVGNSPDEAGLEATYTGPAILFRSQGAFAVCGADMAPHKNGKPVSNNKTITVKKGDLLGFSGLRSGCRAYIAISGGIDLPPVMGSRSTYLRAKLGGYEGRPLRAGDEIPLGKGSGKIPLREIPVGILPEYRTEACLRVIEGPEFYRFETEGITAFFSSEYTVTDQSDRMGYRLSGNITRHKPEGPDIISSPVSAGTIQVPGNGQPIILMADRQTTGGYTRIANVVTADLTLAAQLKPGDKIRFAGVSLEEARDLLVKRKQAIKYLASHA